MSSVDSDPRGKKISRKSTYNVDADSLYETAVRALSRGARSSGEIRQLLAKKKASKPDMDAVLKRLRENGYLDDARFARSFVAARLEDRLQGKARVRRDLAARRVRPDLIQQAVEQTYKEVDEGELLRQYIRRKLRFAHPPEKPSAVATLYRRLLRAGFRSDTIVRELKGMLPGPLFRGRSTYQESHAGGWEELLDSLSEGPEDEREGE